MSLKTSVESRESPLVLLTIAKFYYMEEWWLFHLHGRDGVGEGGGGGVVGAYSQKSVPLRMVTFEIMVHAKYF